MPRQRLPTDPCPHCGSERFGRGRQRGVRYVQCKNEECKACAFVDEDGHDLGPRKTVRACPDCGHPAKALTHNGREHCSYRYCAHCDKHWKYMQKTGEWFPHEVRQRHRSHEEAHAAVLLSNNNARWRERYRHLPHDFHVLTYLGRFHPERLTDDERALLVNLSKGKGKRQHEKLIQVVPAQKKRSLYKPKPKPHQRPQAEVFTDPYIPKRVVVPKTQQPLPPLGPAKTARGRIEDFRLERELFGNDPLL